MEPITVVSHSQAEAFQQCEMKFKYAHIDSLEPNDRSIALQRGTNGHAFFEHFFLAIKEGESSERAMQYGMTKMMQENPSIAPQNMALVAGWVNSVWPDLNWKVISVEETFRLNIGEFQYPYTCDLIIQDGQGDYYLVDHKFLGDPYPENVVKIQTQIPKYIAALRKKGIPVKGGIYNIIRTRKLTNMSPYMMVDVPVTDARVRNAMVEQVNTMQEIKAVTSPGGRPLVRTANKMNCGHCSFIELCMADVNNEPTDVIKKHLFKENTYGYARENK